jgi:hypothetical protein
MELRKSSSIFSSQEEHLIFTLRLLIARAANTDSLAWWDDDSLTPAADYVLDRLFPMAPPLAGKSLALRAALTRHRAACPESALHLYRLDADSRDELALRFAPLLPIPVPDAPIATMEGFHEHLLELVKEPQPYTVVRPTISDGLLIEIPPVPTGTSPMLHRAKTLAWAYLEGTRDTPVFPFCTQSTE